VRGNEYSFKVGDYDKEKELVIDPVLASTFLGGSGSPFDEVAFAITFDSQGNVYVAGATFSSNFPGIGAGSAQSTLRGLSDAFVAKLNPDLSSILAATFLGGNDNNGEQAFSITLDSTGNVYVAGVTTASDFPGIGSGSADKTFGGVEESFVAELDPNLSAPGGPTPTPTATPTGSPKPTASPTSSPRKITSPGDCSIGGPVDIGTGIANVLMPLLPAFAIGLRAIRRRAKK
jgi:hypothetical protein